MNSHGWIALDTFVNLLGNSFSIYDAIGSGVNRISDRVNDKEEKKKNEEGKDVQKELNDELKSMAEMMNSKLSSINRLLGCFLTISDENSESSSGEEDCFTENQQENGESNDIDATYDDEEIDGAHKKIKMNSWDGNKHVPLVLDNKESEDLFSYDDRPDEFQHYAVNLIYALLHVLNS